jgi:hypothetical protein
VSNEWNIDERSNHVKARIKISIAGDKFSYSDGEEVEVTIENRATIHQYVSAGIAEFITPAEPTPAIPVPAPEAETKKKVERKKRPE